MTSDLVAHLALDVRASCSCSSLSQLRKLECDWVLVGVMNVAQVSQDFAVCARLCFDGVAADVDSVAVRDRQVGPLFCGVC